MCDQPPNGTPPLYLIKRGMSGGGDDDDDDEPGQVAAVSTAPDHRGNDCDGGNDGRDDHRDPYAVVVKPMYVSSERPSCLASAPPLPPSLAKDDNDDDDAGGRRRGNNDGRGVKRNRGTNKKRPRDAKIECGLRACQAVVRGETCPFQRNSSGGGCKYNHDLGGMLANRPGDISEGVDGAAWLKGQCPSWIARGFCDFGIMCRLGSCHVDMSTGRNLRRTVDDDGKETIVFASSYSTPVHEATTTTTTTTTTTSRGDDGGGTIKLEDEATVDAKTAESGPGMDAATTTTKTTSMGHRGDVSNVLSKGTQILLRKNKYPFVCKRHFEVHNDKGRTTQGSTSDTPALPPRERKLIDFRDKVYVAPLTTVGNLPFRRIMKRYGADITCGEMALADQLLLGRPSEWALLRRHPCEDVFGVQIAAGHPDQYTRVAEILANEDEGFRVDFVDLNLGCPIDMVCDKGAGASLMLREKKLRGGLEGMLAVLDCPVTIKMRTGWNEAQPIAHELVPRIQGWGIDGIGAIMIHGRSRLQRYSRLANWDYISKVARSQSPNLRQIPVIGNGDIFSYTDYEEKILKQVDNGEGDDGGGGGNRNNLSPTAMLARGALIKPWLPTEIKERRHWDIAASERLDMLKDFVRFGLEYWGSDQQGVNHTRRFLLEWLSFLHRYVPVGMLDVIPQQMNHRPPNNMCGRSDLETLMLSKNCADWIKISTMLLGPVPDGFQFEPKHKANSYQKA
ncbi:hypothetical protein ACHAXA_010445 [Cyclostephanos tholiformis]|uniref:tRNA-dihydrouridine(47) synthase [NAD(P)(+)] n=1 Tax=Cyclostephanos tholiformis TaxID=382380 RepID=A0ABD3SFI8_9STRA